MSAADVARLLGDETIGEVCCDARGVRGELCAVELLARLALAARRQGVTIVLEGVGPELRELIELAGLVDALPMAPELPRRPDAPAARTRGRSAASPGRR